MLTIFYQILKLCTFAIKLRNPPDIQDPLYIHQMKAYFKRFKVLVIFSKPVPTPTVQMLYYTLPWAVYD